MWSHVPLHTYSNGFGKAEAKSIDSEILSRAEQAYDDAFQVYEQKGKFSKPRPVKLGKFARGRSGGSGKGEGKSKAKSGKGQGKRKGVYIQFSPAVAHLPILWLSGTLSRQVGQLR